MSGANQQLGLHEEGIAQATEALVISERLNDVSEQGGALQQIAQLLYSDHQLDAAEEAASRAIDLFSGEGERFLVCQCHYLLGLVYRSKGKVEEAVNHFEAALRIASSLNRPIELFLNHYSLAELFSYQHRFDDAHAHIEHAKSHVEHVPYLLGHATQLQAQLWRRQHNLEEAKSEALHAVEVFEKFGATKNVEDCRTLLRQIEKEMENPGTWAPAPRVGL